MKRVGGNVSIEKVPQSKSNAVTITPANSSSSSHDDNNDEDDYYDDDAEEEEEFEPSPPVIRKPNLSQVQITPRNVSRAAVNITPVSQSSGNRGHPQVCTSFLVAMKKKAVISLGSVSIVCTGIVYQYYQCFTQPSYPI